MASNETKKENLGQYSINLFGGEWKLNLVTRGTASKISEKPYSWEAQRVFFKRWLLLFTIIKLTMHFSVDETWFLIYLVFKVN